MNYLDSEIKKVGEEFDFHYYEMAQEILTLRDKVDDLEKELEEKHE